MYAPFVASGGTMKLQMKIKKSRLAFLNAKRQWNTGEEADYAADII